MFSQEPFLGAPQAQRRGGPEPRGPLPGVTEGSSRPQVRAGSWAPLHTCSLLLPLAGRQTGILLIALTTAKPPGQESHLEE